MGHLLGSPKQSRYAKKRKMEAKQRAEGEQACTSEKQEGGKKELGLARDEQLPEGGKAVMQSKKKKVWASRSMQEQISQAHSQSFF